MNTYLPEGVTVSEYTGGYTWRECGEWFASVSFVASDGTTGVQTFPLNR